MLRGWPSSTRRGCALLRKPLQPSSCSLPSAFSAYLQHPKFGPKIGEQFEDFDLAVVDMGQYDDRWRYIHMTPEEAAQAAEELHAHALLPAHVGKFTIANHPWDEPFERILEASEGKNYRLMTPKIGEPIILADAGQVFTHWWPPALDRR